MNNEYLDQFRDEMALLTDDVPVINKAVALANHRPPNEAFSLNQGGLQLCYDGNYGSINIEIDRVKNRVRLSYYECWTGYDRDCEADGVSLTELKRRIDYFVNFTGE